MNMGTQIQLYFNFFEYILEAKFLEYRIIVFLITSILFS